MAQIFENSTPVLRSEVDLFQVLPTETSIEKSSYIEFNPTTNVQENTGQIEFNIPESSNFYRDLQKSFLYVTFQVTQENGQLLKKETILPKTYKVVKGTEDIVESPHVEPDDIIAPVNGLGFALFSQCDVYLNDTLVSQANNLYPYRGAIEAILNYGGDYKQCQAGLALYYDEKNPEKFTTADEDGFKKRYDMIKESSTVELILKPCADIFNLSKYMINGTNIKLKFTRNSDEFCLLQPTSNNSKYKVKINSASMFILSHQLFPSLRIAHERILTSGQTAKYPFRRVEMKTFLIPTGTKSIVRENLFYGQVPLRIVVGFVENTALIGNVNKNPFSFKNFNINYFSVLVDESQISFKPLILDFSKNKNLLGFYTLLTTSGVAHQDLGIGINRDQYKSSDKSLFAFNLMPAVEEDVLSLQRTGNIRFDIHFQTELVAPVNVIVYAEFNSLIEISNDRQVRIEF